MFTHEIADFALQDAFTHCELEHVGIVTDWIEADDDYMLLDNNFKSKTREDIYSYRLFADNKIHVVDIETRINFNFPEGNLLDTLLQVNIINASFNGFGVHLDIDQGLILIRSRITFNGYYENDVFDNFKYSKIQKESLLNLLIDIFWSIEKIKSHFSFDSR